MMVKIKTNAEMFKEVFGFEFQGTIDCFSDDCPGCMFEDSPCRDLDTTTIWLNSEYRKKENV